jgi:hypothetical protein
VGRQDAERGEGEFPGACGRRLQRQSYSGEKSGFILNTLNASNGEAGMAERKYGGVTLGGIIVIVGVVLMFIWSFWIGLIVALIGLIAFGGFVRGKWY